MLGVVKLHKALEIAESAGLDLVEVSPNAKPVSYTHLTLPTILRV